MSLPGAAPQTDPLDQLARDMDTLAGRGLAAPLFGEARIAASAAPLRGAAFTGYGMPATSCDNVALASFRCGDATGLLLAVCAGNYKDEGSGVAAAAAAHAFIDAFSTPLLASVDIPPALRRAMLAAHDAVARLAEAPIGSRRLFTAMGQRKNLKGIGVCVTVAAALADRVWTAHVGEGSAYLVRAGVPRKLTIEHTLANDPKLRADLREHTDGDTAFAKLIVLRVLGLGACPPFDVARAEVETGDRVVVGNLALDAALCGVEMRTRSKEDAPAACEGLAQAMRDHFPSAPSTIGIIDIGARG